MWSCLLKFAYIIYYDTPKITIQTETSVLEKCLKLLPEKWSLHYGLARRVQSSVREKLYLEKWFTPTSIHLENGLAPPPFLHLEKWLAPPHRICGATLRKFNCLVPYDTQINKNTVSLRVTMVLQYLGEGNSACLVDGEHDASGKRWHWGAYNLHLALIQDLGRYETKVEIYKYI